MVHKKVTAELIRDMEETEPVRTAVPHSRGKQKKAIFSSKDKEEGGGVFSAHGMKNLKGWCDAFLTCMPQPAAFFIQIYLKEDRRIIAH